MPSTALLQRGMSVDNHPGERLGNKNSNYFSKGNLASLVPQDKIL
jgi:hypothetical protein